MACEDGMGLKSGKTCVTVRGQPRPPGQALLQAPGLFREHLAAAEVLVWRVFAR